jgi:hypothetical protein
MRHHRPFGARRSKRPVRKSCMFHTKSWLEMVSIHCVAHNWSRNRRLHCTCQGRWRLVHNTTAATLAVVDSWRRFLRQSGFHPFGGVQAQFTPSRRPRTTSYQCAMLCRTAQKGGATRRASGWFTCHKGKHGASNRGKVFRDQVRRWRAAQVVLGDC